MKRIIATALPLGALLSIEAIFTSFVLLIATADIGSDEIKLKWGMFWLFAVVAIVATLIQGVRTTYNRSARDTILFVAEAVVIGLLAFPIVGLLVLSFF